MMTTLIKLALCMLFLICLLHMPFGYYQAVRFLGMLGFLLLAYFSYQQQLKVAVIVYIVLALLFQPFIKIALGRTNWNILDVIVAIGLILSLFFKPQKNI